jgi:hypothetical protein
MSSQFAVGTTSNIDATLNAILRRLDAIELKMEPLQPLQDQVATLETAVQDQATQQQQLDATVNRLAKAQSARRATHDYRSSRSSNQVGTTAEPRARTSLLRPTSSNFQNSMAPATPALAQPLRALLPRASYAGEPAGRVRRLLLAG